MGVSTVLILMGGVMALGFAGSIFFERTRIPDLLILMAIGALLGPILQVLDPKEYSSIAPYFGVFALILILFEGGLELDFKKVVSQIAPSMVLVIFAFILSALGVAYGMHLAAGMELSRSLLLGAILGCTSSAIVIPVAARLQISGESKTILNLESAVGDAFAVIATMTLTDLIASGDAVSSNVGQKLAWSFALAILVSIIIGLLWLWMLSFVGQARFSYIVTLGIVLIIQGAVEHFHGSGALAILLFGMVLANGKTISSVFGRRLKPRIESIFAPGTYYLEEKIKEFHGEFTFFIRTFFFVYLGLIANPKGSGTNFYISILIIFATILTARLLSVYTVEILFKTPSKYRLLYWSMMPRGLTSAVLAFIPIERGISGIEEFVNYVFFAVILTNIILTVGVFVSEKSNSSQPQ